MQRCLRCTTWVQSLALGFLGFPCSATVPGISSPRTTLYPYELWWPFPHIVSACCLQHPTLARRSRAGTLSVPQNKCFPVGTRAAALPWGNFVCSPNHCPHLHTACPWCKVHAGCSAACSLPARARGQGKYQQALLVPVQDISHTYHIPHTTLLPVAIPCPCHGGGSPWSCLPLCPLTGQPASDLKKIQFKAI